MATDIDVVAAALLGIVFAAVTFAVSSYAAAVGNDTAAAVVGEFVVLGEGWWRSDGGADGSAAVVGVGVDPKNDADALENPSFSGAENRFLDRSDSFSTTRASVQGH